MEKIDFKKELKELYNAAAKKPSLVKVPKMNFLMIDGMGDPNTAQSYQEAVNALYAVAYSLKFRLKKGENPVDYGVPPLEGLWWVEDMREFDMNRKDNWKWSMMIMQPSMITETLVQTAIDEVSAKKELPALPWLRFAAYDEGLAAQVLHIGPYSAEGPTIQMLHDFIRREGYLLKGKHHEIYLGDPRKTAPEKLKTIIRQPVTR
ncbi:MAG: GyrI-like domain-containing protein [Spirochaetota bacterium]